jgi:hypothetical protein
MVAEMLTLGQFAATAPVLDCRLVTAALSLNVGSAQISSRLPFSPAVVLPVAVALAVLSEIPKVPVAMPPTAEYASRLMSTDPVEAETLAVLSYSDVIASVAFEIALKAALSIVPVAAIAGAANSSAADVAALPRSRTLMLVHVIIRNLLQKNLGTESGPEKFRKLKARRLRDMGDQTDMRDSNSYRDLTSEISFLFGSYRVTCCLRTSICDGVIPV